MKKCAKCGRELPESEFNKCSKAPDGLQYYCKECQSKMKSSSTGKKRSKRKSEFEKLLCTPSNKGTALSQFTARELIDELKLRGFSGTLTYSRDVTI